MKKRLLEKYEHNPVMSPDMMPIPVLNTFNPGAIDINGETIMVMDCTTLDDVHRFWIARSQDGVHFKPDPAPAPWPALELPHVEDCTYDPRITKIGDTYYLMYASSSKLHGVRVGIVKTKDFSSFERVTIASEEGNRNGCLFPEKFDGLYARLDRPFGNELNPCYMWLNYSPDLVFWGKSQPIMYRGQPFRDGHKMGAGAVPIKTDKGWLEIYHTVSDTCNGFIYRLKACLLSLDAPGEVIGYTKNFILWPEHDYEMRGRVMNVVFTCNALPSPDGTVRIYYGAADSQIGLATGRIDELVAACLSEDA